MASSSTHCGLCLGQPATWRWAAEFKEPARSSAKLRWVYTGEILVCQTCEELFDQKRFPELLARILKAAEIITKGMPAISDPLLDRSITWEEIATEETLETRTMINALGTLHAFLAGRKGDPQRINMPTQ